MAHSFKKERIEEYAKRMSEKIQHENPILMGLSFGGIMCIEIAKIIKTHKVILISSVKSFHEIPLWLKLAGKSKLNKFFPLRSFRILEPIQNYNLGIENIDELKLVREYRRNIGQQYTDWAFNRSSIGKTYGNLEIVYIFMVVKTTSFP